MNTQHPPRGSVVLHADDYGMNSSVNQGILQSFREGLLTSTSLLANAPAAESACEAWRTLDQDRSERRLTSADPRRELGDPLSPFDLGIHLNLTQGRPLTGNQYPAELLDDLGNFPGVGKLFQRMNRIRPDMLGRVETELCSQIEWMIDHGFRPTHLNGHQYVEVMPRISQLIPHLLRRYSIPVVRVARERRIWKTVFCQGRFGAWLTGIVKRYYAKQFSKQLERQGIARPDRFYGTCHAGCVTLALLDEFLRHARWHQCTEIGLHPGVLDPASERPRNDPWYDPLAKARVSELQWLCSAQLRDLLVQRTASLGRLQNLLPTP